MMSLTVIPTLEGAEEGAEEEVAVAVEMKQAPIVGGKHGRFLTTVV
jgi:hypothetical protein